MPGEVDTARPPTVHGTEVNSKDGAGSVGGSTSTYSNRGDCHRSAANADPLPPTGQWSVRFPSTQDRSVFLHRAAIRSLRQVLLVGKGSDSIIDSGDQVLKSAVGVKAKTTLPVFLERRQLCQVRFALKLFHVLTLRYETSNSFLLDTAKTGVLLQCSVEPLDAVGPWKNPYFRLPDCNSHIDA